MSHGNKNNSLSLKVQKKRWHVFSRHPQQYRKTRNKKRKDLANRLEPVQTTYSFICIKWPEHVLFSVPRNVYISDSLKFKLNIFTTIDIQVITTVTLLKISFVGIDHFLDHTVSRNRSSLRRPTCPTWWHHTISFAESNPGRICEEPEL